jgi:hypothetical protein
MAPMWHQNGGNWIPSLINITLFVTLRLRRYGDDIFRIHPTTHNLCRQQIKRKQKGDINKIRSNYKAQ